MTLEWWCESCCAVEPVEPTSETDSYKTGDWEPCIDCYKKCVVRATEPNGSAQRATHNEGEKT